MKTRQDDLFRDETDDRDRGVMTVAELTRRIKVALEGGFGTVTVRGELSNTHLHSSGHFYFTLKDANAQIAGVMWRSRVSQLALRPEEGMKVVATGRITVYEPRGQYQLDALSLRPEGIGELQRAFERLKGKLEAEGLFDERRKREIPAFPRRIGIVTSATGAAIRDMISVITRRFPCVEVILRPAQVQGSGAAEDVAAGIEDLSDLGGVDVMIVGRGGGSLEDLWAFNEEVVARAIARSRVPVISAVGHEVDVTIADYVADLRAPTPSAAAELVVPDRRSLLDQVANSWYTIQQEVAHLLVERRRQLSRLATSRGFSRPEDLLQTHSQRLDDVQRALATHVGHRLALTESRHAAVHQRLLALDPGLPLRRGYALVRKAGHPVASAGALGAGDRVGIEFHDGVVDARID